MEFLIPVPLRAFLCRTEGFPADYRHLRIPGSDAYHIKFPGGMILTQVVVTRYFQLWVHHFLLDKAMPLEPKTDQPVVALAYISNGPVPCVLRDYGELSLSPDQYHLFYVPSISGHEAHMPAGHTVAVHINYDPSWLKRVAGRDPVLEQLIRRARTDDPKAYRYYAVGMDIPVRRVIRELTGLQLTDPVLRDLCIEEKSRFLIRHYGTALVSQITARCTQSEITHKAREIHDYIRARLHERLVAMELARRVALPLKVAQLAFRGLYQTTIGKFIVDERMRVAGELLQSGDDTIQQIAEETGYENFSAFCRAFRRHYGCTPLQYRNRT